MTINNKNSRHIALIFLVMTVILFSYQNCAPGHDSTGPHFDSNGNLVPPSGFPGSNSSLDNGSTSGSTDGDNVSGGGSGASSGDDPVPASAGHGHSNNQFDHSSSITNDLDSYDPDSPGQGRDMPKCVNKNINSKERARKLANAFGSAKKFLENRRCNAYLSGPNGEARKVLRQARIEDFCLSDLQNTLQLLRQVGRIAGMQDIDHFNALEKWIDCFCNVTGKAICPTLNTRRKAKDDFDIQEPFDAPGHRKPSDLNLQDIPLNEDDGSGADELLTE